MELFKIDPGLAIWTWIVFGIMFFILWKYAFPGILNNVKEREDTIAQAVNNASKIQKRLADIEKERAELIKESKVQANDILKQTRSDADALRKELLEKSEQDARGLMDQAKIKMDEERSAMIEVIKSDIADFVCDTSEKVIGRSFVSKDDREWVSEQVDAL